MYGFTTTLTGITFGQALQDIGSLLPCNVIVCEEDPHRSACARLADNGAPVRAV
jgi:hypothetical protein